MSNQWTKQMARHNVKKRLSKSSTMLYDLIYIKIEVLHLVRMYQYKINDLSPDHFVRFVKVGILESYKIVDPSNTFLKNVIVTLHGQCTYESISNKISRIVYRSLTATDIKSSSSLDLFIKGEHYGYE